jgi:hypothetical protein
MPSPVSTAPGGSATRYTYSVVTDGVDPRALWKNLKASPPPIAAPPNLLRIDSQVDQVDVWYDAVLSGAQKTLLDGGHGLYYDGLAAGGQVALPAPAAPPAPIIAVNVNTATTTQSTPDIVAPGMTITPVAGTYRVWFSGSVQASGPLANVFLSIYAGGTKVDGSKRQWTQPGVGGVAVIGFAPFACCVDLTVNGSQAIEGRWSVDTGWTATMIERSLAIQRLS